ncbi:hypothetical protein [Lentibacillus salinarum]|uniref:Uncharacterized protein n=1 Tax=Lentibacillus salinarum TaxID=446820 RepID=A0ABW3ZXY2_9BACI
MELDLFDFDFTESNEEMFSDERVLEKFHQLQQAFKEKQNAYNMRLEEMPKDIIMYLDEFQKRGWIEKRHTSGINIPDDYLAYHTADELIEEYQDAMNRVLDRPGINWYNHVLPIMNGKSSPIRWKNKKVRQEVSQAKHEINKKAAQTLGLKHFLEVPESRGKRMKCLDSKWERKHVIPKIAEIVLEITDFDEMEDLFRNHAFFCGRRDWTWGKSTIPIAPYPEFKRLMPNVFDIACLCEAEDEKTVQLILDYAGCAFGNFERLNPDIGYIYPDGWSMKAYEATLTFEDIELLIEDKERLRRLHNREH